MDINLPKKKILTIDIKYQCPNYCNQEILLQTNRLSIFVFHFDVQLEQLIVLEKVQHPKVNQYHLLIYQKVHLFLSKKISRFIIFFENIYKISFYVSIPPKLSIFGLWGLLSMESFISSLGACLLNKLIKSSLRKNRSPENKSSKLWSKFLNN